MADAGATAPVVWDIVRVAFPHADADVVRFRPTLVVATAPATDASSLVWVLMITSARHPQWPADVLISDPSEAGLSHASLVRTAKIASIDSRYADPIGRLPAEDRGIVARHLRQHLSSALTA